MAAFFFKLFVMVNKMLKNKEIDSLREKALSLVAERVPVPSNYQLVGSLLVNHDAIPVFIFRFQQDENIKEIGGEHFSVSVDLDATKIMGFIHIHKEHCGDGLLDDESAKVIARDFIPQVAPDLASEYEIKWVMKQLENPNKIPHESPFPFQDTSGETHLVTGVRVKLFFEKLSSWGWVIVGREGKIISFERQINWNTIMNRRSTPAWLHDPYIQELSEDIKRLN